MLAIAEAKLKQAGNTIFRTADAMNLPFEDDHFDLIACQFGVMFFPDKVQSYRESLRVLKPGGTFIFSAWGSLADNAFAELAHQVTARRYPANPPAFYMVPFHYHEYQQIEADLVSGGFSDVQIEEVRFSNTIESPADFARGLIFGNPVSAEIEERGGDCSEVRSELEADISQFLNGKLELMALVVTVTKPG